MHLEGWSTPHMTFMGVSPHSLLKFWSVQLAEEIAQTVHLKKKNTESTSALANMDATWDYWALEMWLVIYSIAKYTPESENNLNKRNINSH